MPSSSKLVEVTTPALETLGRNLKRLRTVDAPQAPLTQPQLSARSGVTTRAISEIERREANPTVGTLSKLAHALDVGIAEFFSASLAASSRQ